MGHVRRASLRGLRHGGPEDPGRRRRHRLWHDQRPADVRLQPGLHGVRRRALRGARREDLQDHGSRDEGRRAGDRSQRLRRRAHPGRRRLARRLRRRVPAQRRRLGRDSADLGDHGPVRRRRRVLAGDDRFHRHGEGQLVHVRHRTGSAEDGDERGGDRRGARRRDQPLDALGCRRPRVRKRRRGARDGAPPRQLPAAEQPRAPAGAPDDRQRRIGSTPRSTRSCRAIRTRPTTSRS